VENLPAPQTGFLSQVHARLVGETACLLGAGRDRKSDPIDPAVGVKVYHKVGDFIRQGELLCTIYANRASDLPLARQVLLQAHQFSERPVDPLPLFYGVIC
jgi:pyrimidine-nucleoside phosphorylase